MRRIIAIAFALSLGAAACGGESSSNNGGGDNETNNGTTGGGGGPAECTTDDECPDASDAPFLDPEAVVCTRSTVRPDYCSECVNDSQCPSGHACRDATYCFELPPCTVGADCSDNPGEVHQACVDGFCKSCFDDADCEADEVCYSLDCVTRETVDPTCLDASCEGRCDTTYDADGTPTGVACM